MVYADFVLWVVFLPVALVALVATIRAGLGWVGLGREAAEDYAYRRAHGMVPPSVGEAEFVQTYRRVNGPRTATYLAGTLWAVLLATPVLAKILEVALDALWQASGQSRVFEPGYLVWAFFIFFGLMAGWALIGYAGARLYYRRAPGRLEDELAAAAD